MAIMQRLDELLKTRGAEVEAWLDARAAESQPFIHGSVDLRHSGVKIVPVDTNLFPGGFNNLSPKSRVRATEQTRKYLDKFRPDVKKLLIIPENHTRNLAYLDNLVALRDICVAAGLEVRMGTLREEVESAETLTAASGKTLVQERIIREGDLLKLADGFTPDLVLVNNDWSAGSPPLLKGLNQPVVPPTGMGWYRRRKRVHFAAYDALAREFGEAFGLDHWLISAVFRNCGMVDFRKREGLECVATNVEMVLDTLRVKYAEYGITEKPFVYVKADSGTYGMGIMVVHSGEEVLAMNKKYRQKMDVIKEGAQNSEVIIQEGVPTIDKVEGGSAEPMIYVVYDRAVGGAFRTHHERDGENNLNAPGMVFYGMCDETESGLPAKQVTSCNFGVYSLIARLATLAASREAY